MPSVTKTEGVPQGAPTSCSTATLALRPGESRVDGVRYADDGVYIGKIEECLPKLEDYEMGIEVNKDKTRELKRDGKWLVESFKFLGIRYYPEKVTYLTIP